MRLAYIGSIKDDILNIEELALGLIGYLQEFYPAAIRERYNVEEELKPLDILTAVAKARGCLKKGEELDYEKASRLLLEEFRSGKLGKVTLEFPKGPEDVYKRQLNYNRKKWNELLDEVMEQKIKTSCRCV